jgi:predicted PurR-regulated permease PerM
MPADPTPSPVRMRWIRLRRKTAFETALIAGGLLLFLALLYQMQEFLSPPVVAAAGILLLWPLREQRTVQALLLAGGFLLVFWFLDKLSSVLLPFVVVYLLAYLFDPVVSLLQARYRVPRWASSLGATLLVVGLVVLFIFLLVPSIVSQLETLAGRILDSAGELRTWILTTPLLDELESTGLIDKEQLIAQLNAFVQEKATELANGIPNAAQTLVESIGSLVGVITILSIIPVVLYYMLRDYPVIKDRLERLFPTFGGRRDYLVKAGGIVGNYLRGQLIISAIGAFNVSVALLLFQFPFALLIGLVAGLLNMIPNLGSLITIILGVLVAVIFGDPWYIDVIVVVAVLLGQGLLEQSVLTPNIMSHQVGLHPVLIMLSLFVFGYLMGIFGLLIAVPATALIMMLYKAFRHQFSFELSTYGAAPAPGSTPDGSRETSGPVAAPKDATPVAVNPARRTKPTDA